MQDAHVASFILVRQTLNKDELYIICIILETERTHYFSCPCQLAKPSVSRKAKVQIPTIRPGRRAMTMTTTFLKKIYSRAKNFNRDISARKSRSRKIKTLL